MAGIAILGYGVVGSGVFEALQANQAILKKKTGQSLDVKRVLDLKDFPGNPVEPHLTKNIDEILNDPGINVVVETMGGLSPAYEYTRRALEAGKHAVTSNKALVAKHGASLLKVSKSRHVSYLFEASVGGAIPIIRPLNQLLASEEVQSISGILNGTTNFILTQMEALGMSFDEALAHAREKGYAENDPSADVDGWDAGRKLAILLSLSIGKHVDFLDIPTDGIRKIDKDDLKFAAAGGGCIKLMAIGEIRNGSVEAAIGPMVVAKGSLLSTVDDVYNSVMITGNISDNILFYGRGAGKFPTAGAVVADIVDALKNSNEHIAHDWSEEVVPVVSKGEISSAKQVRIAYSQDLDPKSATEEIFESELIWIDAGIPGQSAFISPPMKEKELELKLDCLETTGFEIKSALRIFTQR
ncbi:MAG: homoserine dehydrogenase [Clostridiales bacterium]|jgi:homoserine dehydrogenase|nr:homoserine dehydrogenase [Clostridiales bacterium]